MWSDGAWPNGLPTAIPPHLKYETPYLVCEGAPEGSLDPQRWRLILERFPRRCRGRLRRLLLDHKVRPLSTRSLRLP